MINFHHSNKYNRNKEEERELNLKVNKKKTNRKFNSQRSNENILKRINPMLFYPFNLKIYKLWKSIKNLFSDINDQAIN